MMMSMNNSVTIFMKVLILGDIFGRPGRDIVKGFATPEKEHEPDFVIAMWKPEPRQRLHRKNIKEMHDVGTIFSLGNHVWNALRN